jgi:hypothetical protein
MKAIAYFKVRALEYERRARETTDLRLKEAYGAIAADMRSKAATADPDRRVIVVDGVAVDASWTPDQSANGMHTLI